MISYVLCDCHTIAENLHKNVNFYMPKSDNSLSIRNNPKSLLFVTLYVEDLAIIGESLVKSKKIIKLLSINFKMKDVNCFFGINVI